MAEISQDGGGSKRKGGKVRSKKMSTRIDFTPMVDLGFLLITFFMLTTTLAKPQIMALVMPEKDVKKDDLEPVKESKVLTLLLGGNDKVYWYEGITNPTLDSTDYSAEGLRRVILDKMEKVKGVFGLEDYEDFKTKEPRKGSYLNVIIKPTKDSRYKNLVDALDEMAINKVRYYVILDVSEAEEKFIANPAAGLDFDPDKQADATSK
ncbi:MAG: ExbD/TolR family protein [Saprospiraceae bacterium]